MRRSFPLAIAAVLGQICLSGPALAEIERFPGGGTRRPGAALEMEPAPPALPRGWRLGGFVTAPYGLGASLGYMLPLAPVTIRLMGGYGLHTDAGFVADRAGELRLSVAASYFLVPGADAGPYVETGLGWQRTSLPVRGLPGPVVPHLGFGHLGRLSSQLAWDLNFSAAANGLLALDGGLVF